MIENDKSKLCQIKLETMEHIIAGCSRLVPSEQLKRHDNLAKVIHQKLCRE